MWADLGTRFNATQLRCPCSINWEKWEKKGVRVRERDGADGGWEGRHDGWSDEGRGSR